MGPPEPPCAALPTSFASSRASCTFTKDLGVATAALMRFDRVARLLRTEMFLMGPAEAGACSCPPEPPSAAPIRDPIHFISLAQGRRSFLLLTLAKLATMKVIYLIIQKYGQKYAASRPHISLRGQCHCTHRLEPRLIYIFSEAVCRAKN